MNLNEIDEIFDRHCMAKLDYHRLPSRENEKYNYSDYVAVAIAFCSLWIFCSLKHHWLANVKYSLCNRILKIWKREHSSSTTPIEAKVNHPKNTTSLNELQVRKNKTTASITYTMNEKLDDRSFPDTNNVAKVIQKKLILENVFLRRQLLTAEIKLCASMRQSSELRKRLLHVKGNETRREKPLNASLAHRRRSSFFDSSTKRSNIWGRGVNGNSTKLESTGSQQTLNSLKDNVRSSELVSLQDTLIQKEEMINKLMKLTEELFELNKKLQRENERMKREERNDEQANTGYFKVTRASSSSEISGNNADTSVLQSCTYVQESRPACNKEQLTYAVQ